MTVTEILSELEAIDRYLGEIDPRDEPGTVTVRGRTYLMIELIRKDRKRRAFLVRKLKRVHNIDYEAICRAEKEQQAREWEELRRSCVAVMEQITPDHLTECNVQFRLEQLCQELHCEYLLAYGKGIFPQLVQVWAALQRHPNNPEDVLRQFGLEHEEPDFILDLMRRAGEP